MYLNSTSKIFGKDETTMFWKESNINFYFYN